MPDEKHPWPATLGDLLADFASTPRADPGELLGDITDRPWKERPLGEDFGSPIEPPEQPNE